MMFMIGGENMSLVILFKDNSKLTIDGFEKITYNGQEINIDHIQFGLKGALVFEGSQRTAVNCSEIRAIISEAKK